MDKNGNITISYETWKNGIQTPYTGVGDIVNLDIFETPGILKLDFQAQEVVGEEDITSGTTNYIGSCAIDSLGDAVMGTDEGDVIDYNGTSVSEDVNSGSGDFQHAVYWKGYTIFADYDPNSSNIELSAYDGTNFYNAFEEMPAGSIDSATDDYRFSRGAIVEFFDWVFVGSGKWVGYLEETVGQTFDPSNNATYSWTPQALELPGGLGIDSMIIFNDFLLTSAGNPDTKEQSLFPWRLANKAGASFPESFEYPTPLNNGVAGQAISSQNLAYFLDGSRGQFRVTNRSNVEQVVKFENITFPNRRTGIAQTQQAITLLDDVFMVGVSNESFNNETAYPIGLYKVKDGAYTRQTLSEDLDGSDKVIRIHFVRPFRSNNYLVGWQNVTDGTFGVDEFGLNNYKATSGYLESPLYQPGLILNDKSYQQLEINLAKPLATGQGIKVYYRKNTSDSWTELGTYDFATYGAVSTINATAGIIDVSQLQVKVELTTGASSTTTPELISVKLF